MPLLFSSHQPSILHPSTLHCHAHLSHQFPTNPVHPHRFVCLVTIHCPAYCGNYQRIQYILITRLECLYMSVGLLCCPPSILRSSAKLPSLLYIPNPYCRAGFILCLSQLASSHFCHLCVIVCTCKVFVPSLKLRLRKLKEIRQSHVTCDRLMI